MQDDFDIDLFLQDLGIDLSEDVLSDPKPEEKTSAPAEKNGAPEETTGAPEETTCAPAGDAVPAEEQAAPRRAAAKAPERKEAVPARSREKAAHARPREEAAPARPRKEREAEEHREKTGVLKSSPFFAALLTLTVVAWALPLRPTVSESEKRSLKTFPEFSVSELLSGDYFTDIDDWFSDTFTFRESWMSLANRVKACYGIRDVAIYSNAGGNAALGGTAADNVEEEEYEDNLPTAESLGQTEETEETPEETEAAESGETEITEEPEEDEWGGVVINDDDFVSEANVLVVNNATFKYTAYSEANCDRFAEVANRAGDLLEGKANFYVSLVPENGTSMLTKEDRLYYGFKLEEDAFERIYSQLNDNVKAVNVIPNLQKHNDEYIVFRTDHHWTALGAYYAYETWCETAGVEPVPLSEYKEYAWEGFLGTYYYTTGELKVLGDTPDTVYAYEPPGNVKLYLNFTNNDGIGSESDILLDRSKCQPGAKYMTFIGSDECRATFVNEDITDGSAVMVIKNSFGNPYVYYLTQHYQYVYVVDYRYYGGRGLTSFVENFDIDDVILCAGLGFVAEDGGYSILDCYFK